MPMQFWPEDWKTPRMRTEEIFRSSGSGMSSRITAGSLPPSSTQRGIRDLAAEAQTEWATGRDPMNVRWEIEGCEVRWEATAGQQTTDWMMWGEWPQDVRAARAIEEK